MNIYLFDHQLRIHHALNDVKGFYPYVNELKNCVFRFKRDHINDARKRLGSSLGVDTLSSGHNGTARKIVSIHLRLGDYGNHLERGFNLPLVPNNYFTRAMQFITEIDPVSL